MTRSTPPHSSPPTGNSNSRMHNAAAPSSNPNTKTKKSRLARLKNILQSSTSNPDPVPVNPPLPIATSTGPKATPIWNHRQAAQRPLRTDIFHKNGTRIKNEIRLPGIGDRIEETPLLVVCASLLSTSAPSPSSLDGAQLDWKQKMDGNPLEKEFIQRQIERMVEKFILHPTKDTEAVREIVLLGPVLNTVLYRKLLSCFLVAFHKSPMLDVELLQGLVQLVEDAPLDYLRPDDMIQILRSVRWRLEDSAQQFEEYSVYLTLAVSRLLDVMASQKVKDLNRVQEHEPLFKVLTGLKTSKDPFLRYQALHAFQALQWVPDDETTLQCSFRHFAGMASGLVKVAGVIHLNFNGFLGGLGDVQKTASETFKFIKAGWEDVPALVENGRGLFDSLKEGLGSGQKALWYITLRSAQNLVRKGQFADLNRLICEAPSHRGYLFQWGICELFGKIAIDQSWDENTRCNAVEFLGELFKTNLDSKQHQDVRRWVLTVLHYISESVAMNDFSSANNSRVKNLTDTLLRDLERRGARPFPYPYLLGTRLPLPKSSMFLREVNNSPDLDLHLTRLRNERVGLYDKKAIYIPPMSKASLHSTSDTWVPLAKRVAGFLESKREVMLILGDSGAGKSTYNLRLEHELWGKYQSGGWIPLFIDLKAVNKPDYDMVQQHLEQLNLFSTEQIDELKKSGKFILICDGYDECRKWTNLHANNRLNRPRQWQAKMVISCRSQYLVSNYRSYLEPQSEGTRNHGQSRGSDLFEEAVIVPFDKDQIKAYIEQYAIAPETRKLLGDEPVWGAEKYMEQLNRFNYLMDLIENPFLLKLVLDTLPRIDVETTYLTRVILYDEFVEQHFENELDRLTKQKSRDKMSTTEYEVFTSVEEHFIRRGIDFSKHLAEAIFKKLNGVNAVEYSAFDDEETWKTAFFGSEAKVKLLRESSQLVCRTITQESNRTTKNRRPMLNNKSLYAFTHRSILEYFYSCQMYDPRGNPRHFDLSACLVSTANPSPVASHPFNQKSLVSEPSITHFLAERVVQNPEFKDQLHSIVQLSKKDASVSQAASNAITILVRAAQHFHGADLRGIQIPNANLTGGLFDSAQLNGANLNGVNFTRAWLRQADLSNAQMKDVWFGEKPSLNIPGFNNCATSTDGKILAVGHNASFSNGCISVYDVSEWKQLHYFAGHSGHVWGLDLSRSGLYLASGGVDHLVRIWSLKSGESCRILEGHSSSVTAMAFSPDGCRLASGSLDGTVRIWDADSGSTLFVLEDNMDSVKSVAWSPDGTQIASGTDDGRIGLWRASTGELERVLTTGSRREAFIAYSPDGQRLVASAGKDLELLDPKANSDTFILRGHAETITCLAFSPDGQRIASGGWDRYVILWDAQTGVIINKWAGHSEFIKSVTFLNDREVVSGTQKSVKIWELGNELDLVGQTNDQTGMRCQGHDDGVTSVLFMPDGEFIFSYGREQTVRQWDAKRGSSLPLKTNPATANVADYESDDSQIFISRSKLLVYDLLDARTACLLDNLSNSGAKGIAYSRCGR
ncbi:hypothetical protein BG006_010784, partial [Podila minutissima]